MNILVFRVMAGWASKQNASGDRSCVDHRLDIANDDYVEAFIAWLKKNRIRGRVDWVDLIKLNWEFAQFEDRQMLSSMSLSKALAQQDLKRGWRYLCHGEAGYQYQIDRGCQRPRRRWFEI